MNQRSLSPHLPGSMIMSGHLIYKCQHLIHSLFISLHVLFNILHLTKNLFFYSKRICHPLFISKLICDVNANSSVKYNVLPSVLSSYSKLWWLRKEQTNWTERFKRTGKKHIKPHSTIFSPTWSIIWRGGFLPFFLSLILHLVNFFHAPGFVVPAEDW